MAWWWCGGRQPKLVTSSAPATTAVVDVVVAIERRQLAESTNNARLFPARLRVAQHSHNVRAILVGQQGEDAKLAIVVVVVVVTTGSSW